MFPQTQERLSLCLRVSAVSCYWNNIADKGTLMKEGSCQLMVYKGMWSILEAKVWSHGIQSGSRKKSAGFRLFIQSWTPASGIVPPTLKVGLPSSVKFL